MSRSVSQDELQPDEVARLGTSRKPTRNQRGFGRRGRQNKAAVSARFGRGTTVFSSSHRPQRATVKVHLVRHQSAKRGRESLSRHVRYLGRDGVTRDGESALFYSLEESGIDVARIRDIWSEDRHHFRIIVSPELGNEIEDLHGYTREVVRRVEADLQVKLEWIAVDHFNTDQPHSHVLIRGREKSQDLLIARDYIKNGFRGRASEVATELLGERTPKHAHRALQKQLHAERWTELDRMVEVLANQQGNSYRINLSQVQLGKRSAFSVQILSERMEVLGRLGLAERDNGGLVGKLAPAWSRPRIWKLKPGYVEALRDLGQRNDVIKQVHLAMGKEAQSVLPYMERLSGASSRKSKREVHSSTSPQVVVGRLLSKGPIDEISDRRFVVVEDLMTTSKRAVQGNTLASAEYDAAKPGAIVRIQQARNENLLLRVLSDRTLEDQTRAKAWTWLDRELYKRQLSGLAGAEKHRPELQHALQGRAAWLVKNGYASSSTEKVLPATVRFHPSARHRLQQLERGGLER